MGIYLGYGNDSKSVVLVLLSSNNSYSVLVFVPVSIVFFHILTFHCNCSSVLIDHYQYLKLHVVP